MYFPKASGKSVRGRPGLDKGVKALRRGATIKALDRQFLDLSTTIGKGILAFLSACLLADMNG